MPIVDAFPTDYNVDVHFVYKQGGSIHCDLCGNNMPTFQPNHDVDYRRWGMVVCRPCFYDKRVELRKIVDYLQYKRKEYNYLAFATKHYDGDIAQCLYIECKDTIILDRFRRGMGASPGHILTHVRTWGGIGFIRQQGLPILARCLIFPKDIGFGAFSRRLKGRGIPYKCIEY